jgi:hypothetical protein
MKSKQCSPHRRRAHRRRRIPTGPRREATPGAAAHLSRSDWGGGRARKGLAGRRRRGAPRAPAAAVMRSYGAAWWTSSGRAALRRTRGGYRNDRAATVWSKRARPRRPWRGPTVLSFLGLAASTAEGSDGD